MKLFQILIFALGMAVTPAGAAPDYPDHRSLFVNDFADLIDPATEARIDTILRAAKAEKDLEFTVVTVQNRGDYGTSSTFKTFAVGLFNHWGVGNAGRNDGILVLVSKGDREMRIVLGDGYPASYDDRAKTVIDSYFIPYFKRDNYAAGIESGVGETLKRMALDFGPDNRPTFKSRARNETRHIVENAKTGGFWAWFFGLFTLGGAGIGTVVLRRWLRFRPRTCDICNRKMRRLAEFEDDSYLEQGQRVEEALKSKDYDVWYCPRDDHTMIEGYKSWFTSFAACPDCGYYTLHSNRTITTAATKHRTGKARVDYNCRNCKHHRRETIVLSKISTSSSSSSGGSSFGGGSSSGGGAGGSW